MFELQSKKKYDPTMRNKAYVGLLFRVLVAGYIIYLALQIAFGTDSSESSMPIWCVIVFCSLFTICAVAFIVYAIISFRRLLKQAEITETSEV